jgi:hypothetical protein
MLSQLLPELHDLWMVVHTPGHRIHNVFMFPTTDASSVFVASAF